MVSASFVAEMNRSRSTVREEAKVVAEVGDPDKYGLVGVVDHYHNVKNCFFR